MRGHNQIHVCWKLEYKQKIGTIVTIQARDGFCFALRGHLPASTNILEGVVGQ